MTGARVFVAALFLLLGAAFIASTGFLVREFQDAEWGAMVVAHSHLFFFFPVFGILALAAFYLPAVVFTDLYWRHLPYGKLRFVLGAIVVAGLSLIVSKLLDTEPRALWEVSPGALLADRGDPQGCGGSGASACRRAPILATLAELRKEGQRRLGLSKFARSCLVDPMLEPPEEMDKERHCFPAGARLKAAACCEAQRLFRNEITRLQADPAQRSLSATYDQVFLPLKVFFILIVVLIAAGLARWRDRIDQYYGELVPTIERSVIIGAFGMLFWPIMDYGYQQTANVLFGRFHGVQLRFSLVIVPWALLLLFYFLRRLGKQGEMIGQIAGVVTAAVAVLRYEDLNDWAVRLLGIGTNMWIIGALVVLAVVGFVGLVRPFRGVQGPLSSQSASS
jgi:hypothetical protein